MPDVHGPEPERALRQRRRRPPVADHEALPGAARARPVLRLRAREHARARWSARAHGTARSRPEVEINVARLVRPGRPGQGDRSTCAARSYAPRPRGYTCARVRRARRRSRTTTRTPPRRRATSSVVPSAAVRTATAPAHSAVRRRARPIVDVAAAEVAVPRQRRQLHRPRARRRRADRPTAGRTPSRTVHREGRRSARQAASEPAGRGPAQRCTCTATRHARRLPEVGCARRRRVVTGPRRPRRRQPQRADLRRPPTASCTRTAPDGCELPGWPAHGDAPPLHTGEPAFKSGAVPAPNGGAILASVAVGDLDRDGRPRWSRPTTRASVYAWNASAASGSGRASEHRALQRQAARAVRQRAPRRDATAPSTASSPPRCSPISTATTGSREIVLAGARPPRLRVERRRLGRPRLPRASSSTTRRCSRSTPRRSRSRSSPTAAR